MTGASNELAGVLARVVDVVGLGIAVFDPSGTVVVANERLRDLLGNSIRIEIGGPEPSLDDRILVGERQVGTPCLSALSDRRTWRYRRADDDLRWLTGSSVPIDIDGVLHVLAVIDDVTDRREAEDARTGAIAVQRQLAARLEEANALLERSNAELDHFAGALAHDLKGPLANIASFSDLLPGLVEDAASDVTMVIDRIKANARRAMGMVSDLLAYARTVGEDVERVPVDLGVVLSWVVETLERELGTEGGLIAWQEVPPVLANEAALRQIFLNLVGNSLKYRHADRRPAVRVEIGGADTDEQLTIRVIDNGRGIPDDVVDSVFTLGVRGVEDSADRHGSGIGLAATRAAVESHGGTIRVASSSASGTTIELTLPRLPSVSSAHIVEGTVMVVDDDPDVAAVVRLSGRRVGLELIAEVTDGRAAVEVFASLPAFPSVVVLDLTLPGTDGFEVARKLHAVHPDQHIVLHTSHLDDAVRAMAADAGIDECVAKGSGTGILDALTSYAAHTQRPAGPARPPAESTDHARDDA